MKKGHKCKDKGVYKDNDKDKGNDKDNRIIETLGGVSYTLGILLTGHLGRPDYPHRPGRPCHLGQPSLSHHPGHLHHSGAPLLHPA